jgi:uncharacterized protein (DUF1800 family)
MHNNFNSRTEQTRRLDASPDSSFTRWRSAARRCLLALCALVTLACGTFAHAQTPNLVGFWWKPNESGWGLSVQQQGSSTFAVWWVYGTDGKPTWFTLTCTFSGNTCAGTFFTATGVPFAQLTGGANINAVSAGSASLTLTSANRMTLSYNIGGTARTRTDLEPFIFGNNVPTCTLQTGSRADATNYTDLWWGSSAAAGWGLQISHQGSKVFLGWYGFNDQRNASWYTGIGDQDAAAPTRVTGKLFASPAGVAYNTNGGPPPAGAAQEVGTFTLNFVNGERGSFTYTLTAAGVANRALPIERFAIAGGNMNMCGFPKSFAASAGDASRFLAQAGFGGNAAQVGAVVNSSPDAWLTAEFAKPQTLHLPATVAYLATQAADRQTGQTGLTWSLWQHFATADDQLRQRMAYNLSQIFVIGIDNSQFFNFPRGTAHYFDTLAANAFGNFRTLLEEVTLSPMMGTYLSSLRNTKENNTPGSVPDENYAREVMQLFTIGLYQLNLDGTQKLDAAGKPIDTYSNADVSGLAKVFTGWSWAGPDTSNTRFSGGGTQDPDRQIKRMQAYDQYHSISEKRFLGTTIPARTSAAGSAVADMKVALDTLFNHPNVGPFIGKQLIQRMVTANPSPAYVARVATVFNNNGAGVRGDMRAVIRAVLLDAEARNPNLTPTTGKVREPVLRFVQWMRAFNVKSADGRFLLGSTSDPASGLAYSPMRSGSVFNFYRPGYIPPNSKVGNAGLVSPESQVTNETSVVGYLNFMRNAISSGVGTATNNIRDIQPDYATELTLADNPGALLDRVDMLIAAGKLSDGTRDQIRNAIASVAIGTANPANDRRNRVNLAIFLVMSSPEYLAQK